MRQLGTKYALDLDSDVRRRIEVEIGDTKQEDFYPQMKLKHWDNECNFSIRLKDDAPTQGQVEEIDQCVDWRRGGKTASIYQKDSGDMEFEVQFDSRPDSNVVEYTIKTKGLSFFYQPALTPEEIEEGCIRPDNVVGSYAVYHKTKANNGVNGKDYVTGKAFHIYRPYVDDSNGRREWCDLSINEETGILSITVPQNFIDTAVYPIIVDPTFGNTTIGGTAIGISAGSMWCANAVAPSDGTIQSVSGWFNTSSTGRNVKGLVVNSTKNIVSGGTGSGVGIPNTGVATTMTDTVSNPAITNGSTYYASFVGNTSSIITYYDSLGSSGWADGSNSYTSPTDPTDGSVSNRKYSYWFSYTASGGGPATKSWGIII